MAVTELWLVRHGESVGNVAATRAHAEGLDVIPLDLRDADVPLSSTGEDQARALGEWLSGHRAEIDAYWVSPYLRARQTLDVGLGDERPGAEPIVVDERLRDRELGILDLLTMQGVERFHPEEMERRRHLGKFYHRPPGGESWADVALRLRSFLRDALSGPEERAMIVAHDAVVMLLLYVLLPLDEAELLDFAAANTVDNASVTHVRLTETGWELVEFSSVGHLEREGAPVTEHAGSPDVQPE
ncbi:histidine phosphatase family protein [Microbacterium sp.]|jgi:probable phosphoglycerate mutase|uniref:histidine phosphatase family protein n=1 Tax=Microbacterium sp. TaxID=51671 RepID=UPI0037C61D25